MGSDIYQVIMNIWLSFFYQLNNILCYRLVFSFWCEQSIPEQRNGGGDGKHASIPIGVGEGSFIKRAIIDKNAKIGKNVKVLLAKGMIDTNTLFLKHYNGWFVVM